MRTDRSLRLIMPVAALAAGLAVGHWVIPPRGSPGAASHGTAGLSGSQHAVAGTEGAGAATQNKPFTGTAADLIALARKTGDFNIAQANMMLVLAQVSPEDLKELAMSFPWREGMSAPENAAYSALLARWAEADGDGAMAWCETLPPHQIRSARWQILPALASHDPDKALEATQKIKDAQQRSSLLRSITAVLAHSDPLKAFSICRTLTDAGDDYRYIGLFSVWAENDPAKALEAALSLTKGSARSNTLPYIFGAWASRDPEAAFAAAQTMETGAGRNGAVEATLSGWAKRDPVAAWTAAQTLPEGRDRTESCSRVIQVWAGSDPQAALRALMLLPKDSSRKMTIYNLFATWANSDPQQAAEAVRHAGLSQSEMAASANRIAQGWGRLDPQAALAWVRTLPPSVASNQAVSGALECFAQRDGPAAAAAWRELPPALRSSQARVVANGWAAHDPGAVLQWLQSLPESDRDAALRDNSSLHLAEGDPKLMAALLHDTPSIGDQSHHWTEVAQQLARKDPAAALEWAQSVEAPEARRAAMNEALRTWAAKDAPAALSVAQTFSNDAQRRAGVRAIIDEWAGRDPDAVLRWAATATGQERELALLRGSLSKAASDPAAGAGVVSQLISDAQATGGELPNHLSDAAREVAEGWFQQDITAASQWAAQLPEGPARENTVSTLVSAWMRFDPLAASEWVRQLPAGGGRDHGATILANGIAGTDPESAFAWAASIGDEAKRENAIRNAVRSWRSSDKEAARAAVQSAPISESVRASLLKQIGAEQ